uniref:RB130 n=1 Tax=Ruegeria sp. PR1b TaxID=185588 RepID=Q8KWB2_9RHOB|nr:type I secretion system permease/ATPase [Ruegeria sp. PR1b]AAN05151.1 RB130 [Ruegeria sp. PR1b]
MSVFDPVGAAELRTARRQNRGLYWSVALFSTFVNLLMLTGPLYMLQVYDRVLGSRSELTLVALSVLVVFLYGMMGVLDLVRGRIMRMAAARFQAGLDRRVFDAMIRRSALSNDREAQTGLSDLESIQRCMASPLVMAAFDLPFTPLFLAGIAFFHPLLGILALCGGAILVAIALLNQALSAGPSREAAGSGHMANLQSEEIRTDAEIVQAMGMREAAFRRWQEARNKALTDNVTAADVSGRFGVLTKTIRLFLQSAMLGLGAYLALAGEVSPGSIIAGSILMGRALAPIELAIGQWTLYQRARKGWENLSKLLGTTPEEPERTPLPKPRALLELQGIAVAPPGEKQPLLRNISFRVEPGDAVGVIGPSGAGKSTLARVMTGAWRPGAGTVRLDGAALTQYEPAALGEHIGYLPQQVHLFEGSIAQNIARLATQPDMEKVIAAAKAADAHGMIEGFAQGYDTQLSPTNSRLSGGQMQRIGLARALYGDPVIVILDEPNSNLDHPGSQALNRAIRALRTKEKAVFVMAHRPAAIQECNKILVIDQGQVTAFGPKDEVLRKMVTNHRDIQKGQTKAGAAS